MVNLLTQIGYGLAAFTFCVLSLLLLAGWKNDSPGRFVVFAVAMTAIWAFFAAIQGGGGGPGLDLVWATEIAKNLFWILFLLNLLQPFARKVPVYTKTLLYIRFASVLLGLLMLILLVDESYLQWFRQAGNSPLEFLITGQLLFAVLGLALVEQLIRNTARELRWGVKHLCVGLGAIFVFDFYLYTDALLRLEIDASIWSSRGFVVAIAAPLIGVTAARNPDWNLSLFVSRRMVLHSTTFFSAGLYMLLMATAGHYIEAYGGDWGRVAQITLLFGAALLLVASVFSEQFRGRVRIFFDKHFFNYRYDYREEWLKVTSRLGGTQNDEQLAERVLLTLAEIVESAGGGLWIKSDSGDYRLSVSYNMELGTAKDLAGSDPLVLFLKSNRWVIDLEEWQAEPEVYSNLEIPAWMANDPQTWMIVPLLHYQNLVGIAVLLQSRSPQSINWENRDLLKTVGLHAASYLAFQQAASALAEARQFEGFNRLSAFVIHDLKNLIAQLSLVARNAARHKDKPEFIEDAVSTIDNAVAKMNRLMSQLQNVDISGRRVPVDLVQEVRGLVANKKGSVPEPRLILKASDLTVLAVPDRLSSVIGHVIQNAQDATPGGGEVSVTLRSLGSEAIVEVCDSGCGMDAAFVETRLFKPFDSTKGLTGMGIGAYECREVITSIGGRVVVESEPGKGTCFRIFLSQHVENPADLIGQQKETAEGG